MHRPERTKWKLVVDRFRPPADLSRRGPQIMPALAAHVHSGGSQEARRAFCGAEETRTPDFLLAKEALYQLSYGPNWRLRRQLGRLHFADRERSERDAVVQTRPHAAKPR